MLNRATGVYIHKCLPWTACSCEGGIRGRLTHALEEERVCWLVNWRNKQQGMGGGSWVCDGVHLPVSGSSYSDDFNYSSSCWTASAGNQMFFVLAGNPSPIQVLLSALVPSSHAPLIITLSPPRCPSVTTCTFCWCWSDCPLPFPPFLSPLFLHLLCRLCLSRSRFPRVWWVVGTAHSEGWMWRAGCTFSESVRRTCAAVHGGLCRPLAVPWWTERTWSP